MGFPILVLTIAALAWGALAFGAVYPWAYWPLMTACCLAGIAGLFLARGAGASRALVVALAVTAAAGLLQVVPLSRDVLERASPAAPGVIAQLEPAFAMGVRQAHPVSIHPAFTWTGLAFLASFSLLLIGSSRLFSVVGTSAIVKALTVLGVVLALSGIIQKAVYNGKIYGFWTTLMGGDPFGPFVNKNHFAGWMLMALPLTLGLGCAGISRGMRGVRPIWRERFLWLSSPEANELILLLAAAAVMALALVMTMSRSGISAMTLALALTGWFVVRGHGTANRKAVAGVYLAVLAIVVMGWVGVDVISARFAQGDWTNVNGRTGSWSDAWHIATLFPATGTGLNTYGVATLFYQRFDPNAHYAQAHNDYLQLAAEGGLLLSVPAAAALVLLVRDIRRRLRDDRGSSAYWIRAGAITGLVAIALQETVEFSLQMPGNAALFAVVCGLALHQSPPHRAKPSGFASGSGSGKREAGSWLMHLLHVVGARPNFMKAAPVLAALKTHGVQQTLVHTGQHYDARLSAAIFLDLDLPDPDINLGVGSGTHAEQTAQILVGIERCLETRPDMVLVYGDVNSTLAATLAAAKVGIPVAHVEAGLRSGDRSMPEEINRLVTDRLASLLFTPSSDADGNLIAEGADPALIRLVGNVMIDTLVRLLPRADPTVLLTTLGLTTGLGARSYVLVTLHRPSNVDDPAMLAKLFWSLTEIARSVPVVFPMHPRTRARVSPEQFGSSGLIVTEPLTYLEFLGLQRHASVVITDSGGIQEETTFLGVPCLTLRTTTERPVTVTLGTNELLGQDTDRLKTRTREILDGHVKKGVVPPLWDGKAAERVAQHVVELRQ